MKARVKATGDIIDVLQTESIITSRGVEKQYIDNSDERRLYLQSELEFIYKKPQKDIDWEERRYEIAKQMLTVTSNFTELTCNGISHRRIYREDAALYAIKYADTLIAELLKKGGAQ